MEVVVANEMRGLMSAIKNHLETRAADAFTAQDIYDILYEWPAMGKIGEIREALSLLIAGYEIEKLDTESGEKWIAL
ncbi:hypothetical protein SAMN06265795_12630 [Noviherbaspirillum humi]|uniref:Uncharacterized protein n=1 Tax=Noviherbaspirillum humi TaxID=1688639 RepID=A0A239LV16_9BURK|nr:hypothetical protein [Noviherbaspirillum humi]SNT33549.1 hypothetical protein SAMN06265795_12630 [Noviherbaspirillum humi]